MREDIDRWNRKYDAGDGVSAIRAEPELADNTSMLPTKGLALELACGKGGNALFLASIGLDVIAADCSLSGLKICQRAAAIEALNVMPLAVDLDQWTPPQNTFDMISVVRFLDRRLFGIIIKSLRPGGILFYKTFNQRHLENRTKFSPDFVLKDGELSEVFVDLNTLAYSETGNSSYLLAQK